MKKITLIIGLFLVPGFSYADSHKKGPDHSNMGKGSYITYEIGDNEWDSGVSDVVGASLDEDDTSWALIWGKHLSPNLDLELGYIDYGEASLSGVSGNTFKFEGTTYTFNATATAMLEGDAWILGIKPKMSISDTVDVFARVGINMWDSTLRISSATASADVSDDGSDLYYGFGLSGTFDNFIFSFSHTRYEFDQEDVDSNGLAISYRLNF